MRTKIKGSGGVRRGHGPAVAVVAMALLAATAATCAGATPASAVATVRAGSSPPGSRAAVARSAIAPRVDCASLARMDLTGVPGAPARITSAADTTNNGLAYCAVGGYIAPQTAFRVLLPRTTWEGDYLQEGCGGFCGSVTVSVQPQAAVGCAPAINGAFVLASDDQGHEAAVTDGIWAAQDPALRVVFGYTSEHSLALVAKAITAGYYGQRPAHSYFDGCSDGGHEALALAQRYPTDFNGILAGAPANNWAPLLGVFQTWAARANMDATGHQILATDKLPALHAAVMKVCANSDGIIVDPRTCTFDPSSIACPQGVDTADCLTPAQVTTVRNEYRGPTDPAGRNLFDGGEPYGSELAWAGWLVGSPGDSNAPADTVAGQFGLNYLKYMAYWKNPPQSFTIRDFPFTDASYEKLAPLGGIYNATDPDLRAFRDHGGKLILYHGWADQAIPPFATIDYYRALEREMGGFTAAQQFSRLYMVPGAYHCLGGGDPSVSGDLLTPLLTWVEHGTAPDALTFSVLSQTVGTPQHTLTVAPFDALRPAPDNNGLNSKYQYIASKTAYQPGNELWCRQDGPTLRCTRQRP